MSLVLFDRQRTSASLAPGLWSVSFGYQGAESARLPLVNEVSASLSSEAGTQKTVFRWAQQLSVRSPTKVVVAPFGPPSAGWFVAFGRHSD